MQDAGLFQCRIIGWVQPNTNTRVARSYSGEGVPFVSQGAFLVWLHLSSLTSLVSGDVGTLLLSIQAWDWPVT